jgi:hypothetical protein
MNKKNSQEKCLAVFVAILYAGTLLGFDTGFTAAALTLALAATR